MKKRDLEGPTDLGTTLRDVRRSICHFMKSFWVKFGWAEACSMAEARCAVVCYFFSPPLFCGLLFSPRLCPLFVVFIGFVLFYKSCRRWRLCMVLLQRRRLRRLPPVLLKSRSPGNLRQPQLIRRCIVLGFLAVSYRS